MRVSTAFALISCAFGTKSADADAWINEFHYDNLGEDQNEFVEVAVTAGTNISGWTLYYYNGSNGQSYATSSLSGVAPSSGVAVVSVEKAGIQNGGSDGFALVDNSNTVIQFISYEGTVTARNGPANGMLSTDVGVREFSSTPIGYSLQLAGSGCSYGDFSWQNSAFNTKGTVNNGQTINCQSNAAPTTSPVAPTTSPVAPTTSPIAPTTSPLEPTASPPAPTASPPAPTGSPLDSNMLTVASGHGTFTSSGNYWVLPAGIADIFIDVESSSDLDFELFDGSTTVVGAGGLLSSSTPGFTSYGGLRIDYSGSRGEQRSGTEGWEYIHIFGTLSSDLTLQLSGAASGNIRYWWGYYDSVRTGGVFKSALNQIISTGPTLTKLSYTPGCWDALKRTDQDWLNTNNVKGIYSRKSIPKTDQDSGCSCNDFWNREHVCPKSICGVSTTSPSAGTDIHSLRAEDKSVNTQRSNKDFFEGGTAVPDCNQCFETSETFEPPDVTKGDAARSIFYMSTRYINNIEINSIGDRSTLELWHAIDSVDAEEIHRNNMIFKIQGNRNPYIDNPAWVDLINW